jgi:2-iminobutanoate/2-iminopropanoate deaminase
VIFTDKAPKPVGPYSQAICVSGWLYTSTNNLKAIVEAAGGSIDNVVKVTVYLRDMSKFAEFNEIYSRYFSVSPPARSVVGVAHLPRGVELEIDAIAYVEQCKT